MDQLDVRDVVPMASIPVGSPRGLDRVEGQPDPAVADRMEVALEPVSVELR